MSNNQFHFLISSERGGSNLISRMLGSHSRVNSPSPTHLLRTLMPLADGGHSWEAMVDLTVKLFNLKLVDWDIQITKEELLLNVNDRRLSELIKYIYSKQAIHLKKEVVFIKEVRTYNLIPFIQSNFQNSKFVYLVRDPRDMALSWKQSPIHRGEIVRGTNVWNKDQTRSLIDYFNLKGSGGIHLVKYEDLVSDARKELMAICKFLDLEFEEGMLGYHSGKNEENMSKATDNWKNLSKPLLKDNFNKFKTQLSENEIKYIEYLNYELMTYLGYRPEYDKVDKKSFEKIKSELEAVERSEKAAYLTVPLEERTKREAWMKTVKDINNLNIF